MEGGAKCLAVEPGEVILYTATIGVVVAPFLREGFCIAILFYLKCYAFSVESVFTNFSNAGR